MLVELVDDRGTGVGACSVAEAHRPPGRLHRAFSVLLSDRTGRVLLQRRAATKTRFASRWSNTCCGHPAPGAEVAVAAARRLAAELALTTAALTEVGVFTYRAADGAGGGVEHEWDHVLVGTLDIDREVPAPDPTEVSEWAWVAPPRLATAIAADPDAYTPWLPGVLRVAAAPEAR
ncbi:MAG: isopentenyl-diphosphate Delta-isomerase [Micromonosporaceae bacterium]|nr:isopentenyl-diphosphate Delta-isomerase [Micromonosporaceae bacterium]